MENSKENILVWPHVRYICSIKNYNPHVQYKKFIGESDYLTTGGVYQFRYMSYSPDKDTPRVDVLVTTSDGFADKNPMIRYTKKNKKDWENQ